VQRRSIIAVLVAVGLVTSIVVCIFASPREPRYKEVGLSTWVDQYYTSSLGGYHVSNWRAPGPWPVANAIKAIGTNALPHLIKWMQYRPSRFALLARALLAKSPQWVQTNPFVYPIVTAKAQIRAEAAAACFQFLGSDAAVAIPDLLKLVNDPMRPAVSMRAVAALSYSGKDGMLALVPYLTNSVLATCARSLAVAQMTGFMVPGTNDLSVVPLLVSLIKQHDPRSSSAAKALGWMHVGGEIAVPALTELLQDTNVDVRGQAANALSYFGAEAKSAVPALLQATRDEDAWVAKAARRALAQIAGERPYP
jgi:hypothetical protein